jgi:hypothetical protein
MKTKLYVCVSALLGLLVGLLTYDLYSRSTTVSKATIINTAPTRSAQDVAAGDTAIGNPAPNSLHKQRNSEATPLVLGLRGGADYALVKVAYQHPELKLTPEVAADLQEIFSDHFKIFASFEAKIAQVSRRTDGATVISIPAFPTQGKQLLDNLLADVSSYYDSNPPSGVVDAIAEIYKSYANSAGQNPVTLTVAVTSSGVPSYAVTKSIVIIDPATGEVKGTGQTTNNVRQDDLQNSPYAGLSQYFPKPNI